MSRFTVRRLITVAALTFAWCALWGGASVANLASGLLVAGLVSGAGIGPPSRGRVRLRPLLRFAGLVTVDLGLSTLQVAREVLTPTDRTDEAIIAVPVPTATRAHLLLLVIAVTVTPGTAVVDTDPDTGTLYLHLLHADRRVETKAHVTRLAEQACAAFPTGPEPQLRTAS